MNSEDLLDYWFEKNNLSKNTQHIYIQALNQYSKLINKTISELYEEADKEETDHIRLNKRKYSFYIITFKKYLISKNKSPHTQRIYLHAIKSFYRAFDITPPDLTLNKGDVVLEKNYGRLMTKKEIRKMVEVCTARNQAIITLMALTGLSQKEVRGLTIIKFVNSINQELDLHIEKIKDLFKYEKEICSTILTLDVTREKSHYRFQNFLAPEVSQKIINWFKEREYGENSLIKIKDLNDYIFVMKNGEKLTSSAIEIIYKTAGQKCGFQHEFGSYRSWRSHGMRKYFISTIINNTGDHVIAHYMAGHKIDSVTRSYWFADPEKLKEKYLTALPYLSLENTEVQIITSKDRQELDMLRNEVQEMREIFRQHNINKLNELPPKE